MKASQKKTLLRDAGWNEVNGKVWYPPAPRGTVQEYGFLLADAWKKYLVAAKSKQKPNRVPPPVPMKKSNRKQKAAP